jgi:hypothetical protein
MSEIEILQSLIFWGPGAVIAVLIIFALFKLGQKAIGTTKELGLEFIRAQQEQAQALGRQAQSMEGLKDSIEGFVHRDNSEHREMLVLLKYIAQNQPEVMRAVKEHDECSHCRRGGPQKIGGFLG